jgi:hypothetical protein
MPKTRYQTWWGGRDLSLHYFYHNKISWSSLKKNSALQRLIWSCLYPIFAAHVSNLIRSTCSPVLNQKILHQNNLCEQANAAIRQTGNPDPLSFCGKMEDRLQHISLDWCKINMVYFFEYAAIVYSFYNSYEKIAHNVNDFERKFVWLTSMLLGTFVLETLKHYSLLTTPEGLFLQGALISVFMLSALPKLHEKFYKEYDRTADCTEVKEVLKDNTIIIL